MVLFLMAGCYKEIGISNVSPGDLHNPFVHQRPGRKRLHTGAKNHSPMQFTQKGNCTNSGKRKYKPVLL